MLKKLLSAICAGCVIISLCSCRRISDTDSNVGSDIGVPVNPVMLVSVDLGPGADAEKSLVEASEKLVCDTLKDIATEMGYKNVEATYTDTGVFRLTFESYKKTMDLMTEQNHIFSGKDITFCKKSDGSEIFLSGSDIKNATVGDGAQNNHKTVKISFTDTGLLKANEALSVLNDKNVYIFLGKDSLITATASDIFKSGEAIIEAALTPEMALLTAQQIKLAALPFKLIQNDKNITAK